MRALVLAAAAVGLATGSGAHGQGAPLVAPSAASPSLVEASEDAVRRMTVPVLVNGQGPYPFVVDTAADRTVISRELAGELGLKPGQPVELNGTGGVDLTPTAHIEELVVGPQSTRDLFAATLAETNLGARGMLGIDSLRDQRIVMDFQHRSMSVQASQKERYGPDVVVVTARRRLGQLVLVDASIGGEPIFVIVDSGAQTSIGNLALRRLIGADADDARTPVQVVSVSGRMTPARFAILPRAEVGGVTVTNLPIAFADLHTFAEFDLQRRPAMLLGMDVMRQFERVVVDFGKRQVSFKLQPADVGAAPHAPA